MACVRTTDSYRLRTPRVAAPLEEVSPFSWPHDTGPSEGCQVNNYCNLNRRSGADDGEASVRPLRPVERMAPSHGEAADLAGVPEGGRHLRGPRLLQCPPELGLPDGPEFPLLAVPFWHAGVTPRPAITAFEICGRGLPVEPPLVPLLGWPGDRPPARPAGLEIARRRGDFGLQDRGGGGRRG